GARLSINCEHILYSRRIEWAIKGQEAVLSAFSPRVPISKTVANLLERFAVALTEAMAHAGVSRVVVESVAFLFTDSIVPPTYVFGRLFFPGIVAYASAMEQVFSGSELDWRLCGPR